MLSQIRTFEFRLIMMTMGTPCLDGHDGIKLIAHMTLRVVCATTEFILIYHCSF